MLLIEIKYGKIKSKVVTTKLWLWMKYCFNLCQMFTKRYMCASSYVLRTIKVRNSECAMKTHRTYPIWCYKSCAKIQRFSNCDYKKIVTNCFWSELWLFAFYLKVNLCKKKLRQFFGFRTRLSFRTLLSATKHYLSHMLLSIYDMTLHLWIFI